MKTEATTIIREIVILIASIGISTGIYAQKSIKKLSVSYYFTSEFIYYDVKIVNSKITFTQVDEEKIKERCAQWIQQSPCWTSDDLITKEAYLNDKEMADFNKLIKITKIKQLKPYYGPAQGERCYSYTLKIDEKKIIYCSGSDGPAEPEAFAKVEKKIREIVAKKFPVASD